MTSAKDYQTSIYQKDNRDQATTSENLARCFKQALRISECSETEQVAARHVDIQRGAMPVRPDLKVRENSPFVGFSAKFGQMD